MKALKSFAAIAAMAIVLSACSDDSALVSSGMEDASLKTVQDGTITFSNANSLMVADALAKGGKAGKVALCHADQDTGVLHRIEVSGNAAGSHLKNHVGDGLIGDELNEDAMVLYDESCEPLAPVLEVKYSFDFNVITGPSGVQCQSGATVYHSSQIAGWQVYGGTHPAHGVQRAPGNNAATFYDGNTIVMATPIAANDAGATYQVDFLGSPSVWAHCGQATVAGVDGLVFQVLNPSDAIVATWTYFPSGWAGTNDFQPASFSYTGDGSGDIRIKIFDNAGGGRFGGGVDDLVISKVN